MIRLRVTGDYRQTVRFLERAHRLNFVRMLNKYGEAGVRVLTSATPKRTGKTAQSWMYRIRRDNGLYTIEWENTNVVKGVSIAILLQYGHGTGTGGYVKGVDYINPAMEPIFEDFVREITEEVRRL